MKEALPGWLRVDPRVIAMVVVFLLIVDLVLRAAVPVYLNKEVRRLPAEDPDTLRLWKEHLARAEGYKIVFLGDSVVYGGGVKADEQTVPSYFYRYLRSRFPERDIQVFNFSLAGCTPADTYNILSFLADADIDLIIYDVNLAWLRTPRVMEHPGLANMVREKLPADVQQIFAPQANPLARQSRSSRYVGQVWYLYGHRIFLNYWWFGQPLKEKIKTAVTHRSLRFLLPGAQNYTPDKIELRKPWYEKNFDGIDLSKGRMGDESLRGDNPRWLMFVNLVELVQSRGTPGVFFAIPLNRTLLDKYGMLNEGSFRLNKHQALTLAQKHGITVFDYTRAVNDYYFVDWLHPTKEGNRELAARLAEDVIQHNLIGE